MNILLGAHGVGKTTLIKEVQNINKNIYCSDGFSRPVLQICEKLNLPKKQHQIILNDLTLWRWESDLLNENTLYTRSIIDSIIYSKILTPNVDISHLINRFDETIKDNRGNIFYIPVEFKLEKDGVRFENIELQRRIEREMIYFINEKQVSIITLQGTVKERLDRLMKFL